MILSKITIKYETIKGFLSPIRHTLNTLPLLKSTSRMMWKMNWSLKYT